MILFVNGNRIKSEIARILVLRAGFAIKNSVWRERVSCTYTSLGVTSACPPKKEGEKRRKGRGRKIGVKDESV